MNFDEAVVKAGYYLVSTLGVLIGVNGRFVRRVRTLLVVLWFLVMVAMARLLLFVV